MLPAMAATPPPSDWATLFERVVMYANDAVVITSADPPTGPDAPEIVFVNPAYTELTGYRFDEVIGRSPSLTQGPDTCPETRRQIGEALRRGQPFRGEI